MRRMPVALRRVKPVSSTQLGETLLIYNLMYILYTIYIYNLMYFSVYKSILADNRMKFTPKNLEMYLICNFIELEPGPDPDFPDPVVRNPGILIKTGFSGF